MQPSDSVHHETIRLVSLSFRLRNKMAAVVSNSKIIECHSERSEESLIISPARRKTRARDVSLRSHDRVGYDMLSARASIAPQKRLVRNLRRRGLFPDADEDYRNRARARGH